MGEQSNPVADKKRFAGTGSIHPCSKLRQIGRNRHTASEYAASTANRGQAEGFESPIPPNNRESEI